MRSRFALCLLLLCSGVAAAAGAESPGQVEARVRGEFFIGIDWSVDFSSPSADRITEASVDAITLTFSGGLRNVFRPLPVRLRLGAGWFPGKAFRLVPGIEIALLEKLNPSGALAFGLYAFADARIAISSSPTLTPAFKLGFLFPVSPSGGICVAAGCDVAGKPTASIAIRNGGYVTVNGPYGLVR